MRIRFLLAAFSLLLVACVKNDGSLVPDVFVNYLVPINDPSISALNSPGGAVVINGHGVAGLIIYRRSDGQYMAYDRCSTVNPEQKCAINLDDPNLTATDPCSGAKFSMYDGSPVKAPAKRSLKQYNVSINNSYLQVIN
jgi:nitrite reductase/ring-hydroxylating ferredoxin subunit